MGTKAVKETKSSSSYSLLSRIEKNLKEEPKWLLIFLVLLLASVIITILCRFWLTSLILLIFSLILSAYSWYVLKSRIKDAEQNNSDLVDLLEKKESYIADFSHRMRTPLNNLPIINDILNNLNIKGDQKELLETLISSTNNMISALNELTMKSAGEISIEPRSSIRFNLRKTIENSVELLNMETNNIIELEGLWDAKVSKQYSGDPIALKQILLNLLGLLREASISDKLRLKLKVDQLEHRDKRDIIRFSFETAADEGSINDLTDEILDNSLAAKIIRIMDGKYSRHSDNGRYKLSFTLPLSNIAEETTVTAVGEKIKKLDIDQRKRKKDLADVNVLLVEDNLANQKIVTISLGPKVNSIETAKNGKEALDLFGTRSYDIILMDIQLPVMDGITVTRKIREIESSTNQHTPIIAVTANAMIGDKEKCLSAGIDDYISKPFQPIDLIDIIKKYITEPVNP